MDDKQPTSERWKPVKGYEGIYEVSDHGRVRSLDRTVLRNEHEMKQKGRILKQYALRGKHRMVKMARNGTRRNAYVHQLVATAFIGERPEGMEVCHWDDNPQNNHVSNLRWGTHGDNMRDMNRNGNNHQTRKVTCPRGHRLSGRNLVPSSLKNGRRDCLSCSRAGSRVKHHTHLKPNFNIIADQYYQQIMNEERYAA